MTEYEPGKTKVLVRSFGFDTAMSYMEHVDDPKSQSKFTNKMAVSRVTPALVHELANLMKVHGLRLLVFSAHWCKDCQEIIPLLARMQQVAPVPMKILGGAKVNLQGPPQWRSPPSPPEINDLAVKKIPAIIFLQKTTEIARVYEQPPPGKTLERHLLDVLNKSL